MTATQKTDDGQEREYVVFLVATASHAITVRATSKEQAEELAEMQGAPGLCHQCARIELGDWEPDYDATEALS